jgi:hypothetical protein
LANFLARGVIEDVFALPTPVSVNWSLPSGASASALTKCSVIVTLHDVEQLDEQSGPGGEHDEEQLLESLPTPDVNNIRKS